MSDRRNAMYEIMKDARSIKVRNNLIHFDTNLSDIAMQITNLTCSAKDALINTGIVPDWAVINMQFNISLLGKLFENTHPNAPWFDTHRIYNTLADIIFGEYQRVRIEPWTGHELRKTHAELGNQLMLVNQIYQKFIFNDRREYLMDVTNQLGRNLSPDTCRRILNMYFEAGLVISSFSQIISNVRQECELAIRRISNQTIIDMP